MTYEQLVEVAARTGERILRSTDFKGDKASYMSGMSLLLSMAFQQDLPMVTADIQSKMNWEV